jgi:bifunctional non-homologous end joining protein LigD
MGDRRRTPAGHDRRYRPGVATPPVLRPMLTGVVGLPRARGRWLVEPKWDGIRAIITVHEGQVGLTSRNGNDVTAAYPELRSPPVALGGRSAVLDAEVVAVGDRGKADFGLLQRRMHVRHPPAHLVEEVPVNVMVFDLLWLDGILFITEPQERRRAALAGLGIGEPPWFTSPLLDLPVDQTLLDTGRDLALEGFMLKRADAPYLPGRRSDAWAKVKCLRRREFVVGGWVEGKKSRTGDLGSLALGVWDRPPGDGPRRLLFMGLAGSGLTGADIGAFRGMLVELHRGDSPFANPAPAQVNYLEPVLVAEVTFSEVTAAGTLRHPVLLGFRTDVAADEVVLDDELRSDRPASG